MAEVASSGGAAVTSWGVSCEEPAGKGAWLRLKPRVVVFDC